MPKKAFDGMLIIFGRCYSFNVSNMNKRLNKTSINVCFKLLIPINNLLCHDNNSDQSNMQDVNKSDKTTITNRFTFRSTRIFQSDMHNIERSFTNSQSFLYVILFRFFFLSADLNKWDVVNAHNRMHVPQPY